MTLGGTAFSPPERYSLFLTRHATPDRSRFDIPYHKPPGPSLTERGRQEAEELGAFLSAEGLAHLLSSPMERTWTTAQIAAQAAGAGLELNTDVMEWQPGESEAALQARMLVAWRLAMRLSVERGIIGICTHGAPVLALLKGLGLPTDQADRARIYDSRNLIPPAGAWLVEKDGPVLSMRLVFVPSGVRLPEGAAVEIR